MTPRAPRIVVAGGGFGGLYAATHLARSGMALSGAKVTLVDRKNYFTFTPLLAEVAAGTLLPDHVTYPYRVLGRRYGFDFVRDSVVGLDPERRLLRTRRSDFEYDYLILALGAAPAFFGNDRLGRFSQPFTAVDDAMAIRNRVIDAHERAILTGDPAECERLLTFVVAGAGPAGVELASEIWTLMNDELPPYYRGVPRGRVLLLDGGDRILGGWDDALAAEGLERLRARGIEVRLETRVSDATGEEVTTVGPDGEEARISSRHLIWTAGTSPEPWIRELPLPTRKSAIEVEPTLQVRGMENVFAVGDVTILEDPRSGRPYPRVAPIAISQGVRAAANIENLHVGRPLEEYHAHHAGKIVSLGGGVALVDLLGFRFGGFLAWWVYRAAYILKLVGTGNKVRVILTLALNRLFEPDISSGGEAPGG